MTQMIANDTVRYAAIVILLLGLLSPLGCERSGESSEDRGFVDPPSGTSASFAAFLKDRRSRVDSVFQAEETLRWAGLPAEFEGNVTLQGEGGDAGMVFPSSHDEAEYGVFTASATFQVPLQVRDSDIESFQTLVLTFATADGGESWELLLDNGYFSSLYSPPPSGQESDPQTRFPPEIVVGIKEVFGGGVEMDVFFREEAGGP